MWLNDPKPQGRSKVYGIVSFPLTWPIRVVPICVFMAIYDWNVYVNVSIETVTNKSINAFKLFQIYEPCAATLSDQQNLGRAAVSDKQGLG